MEHNKQLKALGFSTLEDYLKSGKAAHSAVLDVKPGCRDGVLTLTGVSGRWDACALLLTSDANAEPLVLSGRQEGDSLRFDLSGASEALLQAPGGWLCFLGTADARTVQVSRLRSKGKPLGLLQAPKASGLTRVRARIRRLASLPPLEKPAAPAVFRLYPKGGCHFDTGLTDQSADAPRQLLLVAQPVSRLLSLRSYLPGEAETLLSGQVFRRVRHPQEVKRHPFLFSVVMACYKVEDYLEEAVESMVQQDIGFREHVQLILVDDGSPDNTGKLCDRFAEQYPDNIVVIHKPNGGVASARNAGMAAATGKYINFMDPDDKMSLNALSAVGSFFAANDEKVDVVSIPMYFFEARSGPHWQNYKFDQGTRVISLWKDWNMSCMNTNAGFVRRSVASQFSFDSRLATAEDAKFMMFSVMEKMQLGVVTEATYWYRSRSAGGSLMNTAHDKPAWYLAYFPHYFFSIQEHARKKFGFIPEFVQNTLMMDIQWRFHTPDIPEGVLTEAERKRYLSSFRRALAPIDDHVIMAQLQLGPPHLMQLFQVKYGQPMARMHTATDVHFLANNHYVCSASQLWTFFDFISLKDNTLFVEGSTLVAGVPGAEQAQVYLVVAGDYYLCQLVKREFQEFSPHGRLFHRPSFRCTIPLLPRYYGRPIRIAVRVKDQLILKRKYYYRKFTPFYGGLENQYYYKDGMVLTATGTSFKAQPAQKERSAYEAAYCQSLRSLIPPAAQLKHRPPHRKELSPEQYEQIVQVRSFALNHQKKRPIWLVSDRTDRAGDNGEALFMYLMARDDVPADVYFVIQEDSPDFERMSKIGPVVPFGSRRHLELSAVADILISSQVSEYVFTPYSCTEGEYYMRKYYTDLLVDQKFVFLQHGIIKDDISSWLNRYGKKMAGFVTSAQREYQSILDCPYAMEPHEVWLTGMPRFDRLYNDPQKQIIFCPTWRLYLKEMGPSQFENSSYYQFYSKVLSNPRLLSALDEKGYHLALKLHPLMTQFLDFFQRLDHVALLDDSVPYRKLYAESNLMVTDYSSTAMEFAYQRKPVIYAQFDQDEFFGGHTYKPGYYDYSRDGFGPVTTTVEETVDAILEMINRDCTFAPEYLKRVNDFFPVNDYKNSERVYQKLLELNDDKS